MIKPLIPLLTFLALAAMASGFLGCTPKAYSPNTGSDGKKLPPPIAMQFSSIPLPDGVELDRDKTFIYESGSGTVKVGRLSFSLWNRAGEVVEYFRNEMPGRGWQLIRVVEHDVTVMLYEKESDVCTIMVEPTLGKTQIEIQIGPK